MHVRLRCAKQFLFPSNSTTAVVQIAPRRRFVYARQAAVYIVASRVDKCLWIANLASVLAHSD